MKEMKKILSVITTIALILSVCSITAFAAVVTNPTEKINDAYSLVKFTSDYYSYENDSLSFDPTKESVSRLYYWNYVDMKVDFGTRTPKKLKLYYFDNNKGSSKILFKLNNGSGAVIAEVDTSNYEGMYDNQIRSIVVDLKAVTGLTGKQKIYMTNSSDGWVGSVHGIQFIAEDDAYSNILASYNVSGTATVTDGNFEVGATADSYAQFDNINFKTGGGPVSVILNVTSECSGKAEVYLDSLTNSPIATVDFTPTGTAYTDYADFNVQLDSSLLGIFGIHTVFLKYSKNGFSDLTYCAIRSLRFTKGMDDLYFTDNPKVVYFGGNSVVATVANPWTSPVCTYLTGKYPSKAFTFVTKGGDNVNSELALARIYDDVVSENPDILFVNLSEYDSATTDSVKNFESMILTLKKYCVKMPAVILVNGTNENMDIDASKYTTVATAYGIPVIDVQTYLKSAGMTGSDLFENGVLSGFGHSSFAEGITSAMDKANYFVFPKIPTAKCSSASYAFKGELTPIADIASSKSENTTTYSWDFISDSAVVYDVPSSNGGTYKIYVDGTLEKTVSSQGSALQSPRATFVKYGLLPNRTHTLQIVYNTSDNVVLYGCSKNIGDMAPAISYKDPYEAIKAITIDGIYESWYPISVNKENDYIGQCTNYSHGWYDNVNFGSKGANSVTLEYAVDTGFGNTVYLRKDRADGPIIAKFDTKINTTGGWNTFATMTSDVEMNITGVSSLYITFSGDGGPNIRSFKFTHKSNFGTLSHISAQDAAETRGLTVVPNIGIDNVTTGSYAVFKDFIFDKSKNANKFFVKLASRVNGGKLKLALDSTTAEPIAVLDVKSTGGKGIYQVQSVQSPLLSSADGIHDLYMIFDTNDMCTVESFSVSNDVEYYEYDLIEKQLNGSDADVTNKVNISDGLIKGVSGDTSWACFKNVYFGDTAKMFKFGVKYATPKSYEGGIISVRLGSPTAEPIANVTTTGTGNDDAAWNVYTADYQYSDFNSIVTGVHDVYLTFSKVATANVSAIVFENSSSDVKLDLTKTASKVLFDVSKISAKEVMQVVSVYEGNKLYSVDTSVINITDKTIVDSSLLIPTVPQGSCTVKTMLIDPITFKPICQSVSK